MYQFKATERFWERFYALSPSEKELVRSKYRIFKEDPFDKRLSVQRLPA